MNRYESIFIGVLCLFLVGLSWLTATVWMKISHELKFRSAPIERVHAKLISAHFTPHSVSSSYIPIYTSRGLSHGVSISSNAEQYTTVWDCGDYGRLGSSSAAIFRYAREEAVLLVKCVGHEARIVGIENE